jgi:exopolysaccharide biosynthesis polyprenyl glycosylphosphotransferase
MTEGVLPEVLSPAAPQVTAPNVADSLRAGEAAVVAEAGRAALLWFGVFVLYRSEHPLSQDALVAVTCAALIWFVALRSARLSAGLVLGRVGTTIVGAAIGLAAAGALNSSFVGLHASLAWLATCAFGVFCSATVWDWCVERTAAGRRRVLVVGTEDFDSLVGEELRGSGMSFGLVGAIAGSEDLAAIVDEQRPDIVVLTDEASYDAAVTAVLDGQANVRVAGLASFFEYAFGRVPIERITPAWFMGLVHPNQRVYSRFAKRTFDLVLASFGLLVAAPLLAVLALLTRTSGPILYRQTRVGEGGRQFTIYKLRTMCPDAERDGPALSTSDDARATRIGCVLRRTHLDELPQLWNVVRGDMSIVGPRPERPEFIEQLEVAVPFWNRRLLVKPGITGWAQVQYGYVSDSEHMSVKLSYDLWYLRNRSLAVDIGICIRTIGLQLRSLLPVRASTPRSVDH